MPYSRTTWVDKPSTATPVNAARLNNIEDELVALEAQAGTSVAYVTHGATAGTARPSTSGPVEWTGSVTPTNAVAGDTWWDTTTDPYTEKIRGSSAFSVVGSGSYPQRLGGSAAAAAALPFRNVKDWGALGDGSTDDTTAIAAAFTAMSGGGTLYFPTGDYRYTTLTVPAGVVLLGVSRVNSVLTCTSATGTGLLFSGAGSSVSRLKLTASVTRTSGATVSIQANTVTFQDCDFTAYYLGAIVGTVGSAVTVGSRFINCSFFNPATGLGGAAIGLDNFSNPLVDKCVISGPASGTQPTSGIRVGNGDTCFLIDTNVTLHGKALVVNPASTYNCYGLAITNCYFDSAGTISGGSTVPSADFSPAGNVYNTKISNTWFGLSASQQGCNLLPSGSGVVDGIEFTGCEFIGNGADGLLVAGSGCTNVTITGGLAAGNATNGVRLASACTYVTIVGLRAGSAAGRGANNYGITVTASAVDNYLITACNLRGNTTANLSDSGTGANKSVTANLT